MLGNFQERSYIVVWTLQSQKPYRKKFFCVKLFKHIDLNKFRLCGRLFHSLRNLNYPLPSGLNLQFTFYKARNQLLIDVKNASAGEDYKIEIAYLELYIPKVIISESVYNAIEHKLSNKCLLRYHFDRIGKYFGILLRRLLSTTDVSSQILTGGVFQWESASLFNVDQVPPKFIIAVSKLIRAR